MLSLEQQLPARREIGCESNTAVLTLALPCVLDDRGGIAGGCTYGGLDEAFLEGLRARLPREVGQVRVVNDAELAGWAARQLVPGPGLALTLGFGPGGASFDA